jgi:hypothetical protein
VVALAVGDGHRGWAVLLPHLLLLSAEPEAQARGAAPAQGHGEAGSAGAHGGGVKGVWIRKVDLDNDGNSLRSSFRSPVRFA